MNAALQAIGDALPALRAKQVPFAIERDMAEVIADDERILARHGWPLAGEAQQMATA